MGDEETVLDYMKEMGWFERDVYVVWLHGCTDGWPRAFFLYRDEAEAWVKTIHLNPEGFDIEAISMTRLFDEYAIEKKYIEG